MKKLLISLSCLLVSAAAAFAQTDQPTTGEHPPTARMDKATPDMKAPADTKEQPPAAIMDKATPPMKPGDAKTPDSSATPPPATK